MMCSLIMLELYNLKYNYNLTVMLIYPYGIDTNTSVNDYGVVLSFNIQK